MIREQAACRPVTLRASGREQIQKRAGGWFVSIKHNLVFSTSSLFKNVQATPRGLTALPRGRQWIPSSFSLLPKRQIQKQRMQRLLDYISKKCASLKTSVTEVASRAPHLHPTSKSANMKYRKFSAGSTRRKALSSPEQRQEVKLIVLHMHRSVFLLWPKLLESERIVIHEHN